MHLSQPCPTAEAWQARLEGCGLDFLDDANCRHLEHCPHCRATVESLTAIDGPWHDIAAELRRAPIVLPPPGQRALRAAIDSISHIDKGLSMTGRIHLERMMHRSSIAVAGETAAAYALLKLIPTGPAPAAKPPGLNLALVLDVSGSMYEADGTGQSRLQRVQDAALAAMAKLRPEDTLAVIGFAHNARLLLPPTALSDKAKLEGVLRQIDSFDIDPGGTAMDEGMRLALDEVEKRAAPGILSQVVVLTDGETSGEQKCRALARRAAEQKIHLTLMGVGLDWKAALLKDLANLSHGQWHYIDVENAGETRRVFAEEFAALAASVFLDVELSIQPVKDVRVKRLRQVSPEINDVVLAESGERRLLARLGALQPGVSRRYVLDLSLPRRPDGKYALAQIELTYDLGTGRRESSGPFPLEIAYSAAGPGYANAEVMKHIDEIQLKEMNDRLGQALETKDQAKAEQLASEIVKKSERLGRGAAKKTMLVKQALDELKKGAVARKTMIALEDEVRKAPAPS